MLIALTGVLNDGPDRASGVPPNPRTALSWPLGASVTIRFNAVLKSSGGPVDFNTPVGQVIKLEVRLQPLPLNQPKLLEVTGVPLTPDVPGTSQFVITPAMQRPIMQQPSIARVFYDVWRILADGTRDPLVPASPLYLEPSVTEIP